ILISFSRRLVSDHGSANFGIASVRMKLPRLVRVVDLSKLPLMTAQRMGRVGRAPFSNVRGIRGSCGGDVPIGRRGRDAEAVRDLSHADVRISEHCLSGLNVVLREFRRTASGAAKAPRGGKTRLGALADQAAL